MIVVDASVVVTALGDDGEDGESARSRLRAERLVAPHLIDLEVVSAWRRLAAAGQMEDRRVRLAIADLEALPIDRVAHTALLRRCWELRSSLTVYDATYVALAEAMEVALLTADRKLAAAPGIECTVEVLAPQGSGRGPRAQE